MVTCYDCIHRCVCPIADGCEYADEEHIRDDCEYFADAPDAMPSEKVEELIYKLECLLCHATGGRLSKHTYTLQTMESAVTDYIQERCDEASIDGGKTTTEEIFAEIEFDIANLDFDREESRAIAIEGVIAALKKKYTEGEI